jgi:SAM-dependent methyltransferase
MASAGAISGRGEAGLAAATIFLGAFFLFEIEPLIAKMILPWFGGSAQVWTTCLVFFQAALLAGYLYAHLLTGHVSPIWQARIHTVLLLASLAFLPVIPSPEWKPHGGGDPLLLILGLLAATIGLPFVLLAATSPLVQAWLARSKQGAVEPRGAYRLFALSNAGSMIALLSYPILTEPALSAESQAWVWSAGYCVFVLFTVAFAWRHGARGSAPAAATAKIAAERPTWPDRALWFGLSAVPSALLLSLTNYMLQNIAAIPLFWIVPLALYLASFIFAFGNLKWFARQLWYGLFIGAIFIIVAAMNGHFAGGAILLLPVFAGALFICCMVCHGELASFRPATRYLTEYYLTISAGGAAGGLAVGVAAPALFNANYEPALLIPLTILVVVLAASRNYHTWAKRTRSHVLLAASAFLFCAVSYSLARSTILEVSGNVLVERNFYGSLKVKDISEAPPRRYLANGSIDHGEQFSEPERQGEPLTYYSRLSGVGVLLDELGREAPPLKVGVIGLGAGTLAAYGRTGDSYRFYEINPAVETIARQNFRYLDRSPAQSDIVLGDARLSLEAEPPQQYDVLVVDAFASDAIPMHLLTREAMALYWRHVKPDGFLAVHVSNQFVDLAPVVAASAVEGGKEARLIGNEQRIEDRILAANWVLVTSRDGFFERKALVKARAIAVPPGFRAWTDSYSNLWRSLRIRS